MSQTKAQLVSGTTAQDLTVDNINTTSVNSGQLSNRRININGGFQVFQRSTSATGVGSSEGYFAPDRYRQAGTGSMRYTASQSTDVPAGYGFSNSLKYDCTTASGTVGSGHFVAIEHRLEGQDVQVFNKGTAQAEQYTISFHVKSPKTGIHCLELYDNDNNRHVSKSYTISSANTWQKVTLTFPADTTGAFDNDNAASLRIFFWLMAGTDFTGSTLPSSWASFSSAARATGQVNVFDSTSNDFFLTGVQLEVGSTATDFEHRRIGQEIDLCQRYYFLFCEGTDKEINVAWYFTSGHISFFVRYPTTMRAAPTLTVASGTNYYVLYRNGGNDQFDNFASEFISTEQMSCFKNSGVSGTAGQAGILRTFNSAAKVEVSAEL
tara:strand:+ start:5 stop:1141 length:1137 start_codon:yes stop_codon:yes gene_type:complete